MSNEEPKELNQNRNMSNKRVLRTVSPITLSAEDNRLVVGTASISHKAYDTSFHPQKQNPTRGLHGTTTDTTTSVPNSEIPTTKRKFVQSYWDTKKVYRDKPTTSKKLVQSYWDTKKVKTAAKGGIEFKKCLSLSEKQQCVSEYGLPLILPGMFYLLKLSPFSLKWCMTIVCGHTLETALTNFGPSVKCFHVWGCISPLAHHLIDCAWLHSLISAMVLAPHRFDAATSGNLSNGEEEVFFSDDSNGWKVTYAALLLIQTLPIYLAVSFKTHYMKHRPLLDDNKHNTATSDIFVGMHIRQCFLSYLVATAWIFIASYFAQDFLLKIGVFILNAVPVGLFAIYSSFMNRSLSAQTDNDISSGNHRYGQVPKFHIWNL